MSIRSYLSTIDYYLFSRYRFRRFYDEEGTWIDYFKEDLFEDIQNLKKSYEDIKRSREDI
jgi:hypothetical protein